MPSLVRQVKGWLGSIRRKICSSNEGVVQAQEVPEEHGAVPYPDIQIEQCTEVSQEDSVGDGGDVRYTQPVCSGSDTVDVGIHAHPVYGRQVVCESPSADYGVVCLAAAGWGRAVVLSPSGDVTCSGSHLLWGRRGPKVGGRPVINVVKRSHARIGYGGPAAPGGGWPPDLCYLMYM